MLGHTVKGFQHLGLPVSNIDDSKAFYTQFGFEEIMYKEIPNNDGIIKVSMLDLKGFVLELYQLVGDELAEIKVRQQGHIDHFALDVDNIDSAFEAVQQLGLKPLEEKPVFLPFWDKGVYYFNVQGPDGEKIEFNQRLSESEKQS